MTREEVSKLAQESFKTSKYTVLELATGFGKSKIAIDLASFYSRSFKELNILLLVDRDVHKDNWQKEFDKWKLAKNTKVTTICYASLKNYKKTKWDIVIADEAHHLFTDSRMEAFTSLLSEKFVLLSATIGYDFKRWLRSKNAKFITCDLQDAIEEDILPTPRIILIPLTFTTTYREWYIKHPKSTLEPIKCRFEERFKHIKKPNPLYLYSTYQQIYQDMSSMIDFYKRKHMEPQMLRAAGERLKWLSEKKEDFVSSLLKDLKNRRTLTFCSSIAQTERLGKYCITSKNKDAQENLDKFNDKKIKHITACQMLNEGINLSDCQIGIYANINASDRINKQKFGRILRHKKPVVIIPYFKYTREHEILKTMLQDYDKSFIEVCKDGKIKF